MAPNGTNATPAFVVEDEAADIAWNEKWGLKLHNHCARNKVAIAMTEERRGPDDEPVHICTIKFGGKVYQAAASRKQPSRDLAAKKVMQDHNLV